MFSSQSTSPLHAYMNATLSELARGPRCVCLTGKVVNIYEQGVESKPPLAAEGCLELLVRDYISQVIVCWILIIGKTQH